MNVGANMADAAPFIGKKMKFLLLGGNTIGENTLLRFYVLHCLILPFVASIIIGIHFWRVRKDGGIQPLFSNKKKND